MIWINTIDLDKPYPRWKTGFPKPLLNKIIYKISKCKYLKEIQVRDSRNKGYHIILYCKRDCDLCRLVFDDQDRYARDLFRKPITRNVLFTKSKYFYKGKVIS